jgi:hypothetical protein
VRGLDSLRAACALAGPGRPFADRKPNRRTLMTIETTTEVPVTAKIVKGYRRMEMLPRYFEQLDLYVERGMFDRMRWLSDDYNGGYWEYYELSNGGFFMAPTRPEKLKILVVTNYYEGTVSAEAAGIIACLFAYSEMSHVHRSDNLAGHYHLLREYAFEHPEAEEIFAAIN